MRPAATILNRLSAGAVICASLLIVAACAQRTRTEDTAIESPPQTRLEAVAARELRSRPRLSDAPLPPGLSEGELTPIPADDDAARETVEETIAALGVEFPEPVPQVNSPNPDALRRYIAGREALLVGDLEVAERELLAATELDPSAAEPWRDIAETRNAAGDAPGATAASQEALQRDPTSIDALINVGLHRLRRADLEESARLFARAWTLLDSGRADADAAMPYLVARYLGGALDELGRAHAAEQLLAKAASIPDPFPTLSRYGGDVASIVRAKARLWERVGDLRMQLGLPSDALDAYNAATGSSPEPPSDLLDRRVYALLRTGRPHAAGAALLDELRASEGVPDARLLSLASYLRVQEPRAAAMLSDAIDSYMSSLTPESRREAEGSLLLLTASLSPPEEAAATLRQRLADSPGDPTAAGALIDLVRAEDGSDVRSLLVETIRLVDANPIAFDAHRSALLDARFTPQTLLAAFDELDASLQESLGAALVRAHLLLGADPTAASDYAERAADRYPDAPSIALLRVQILATLARFDGARKVLQTIDPSAGPDARLASALAQAELDDAVEALETVIPLADAESVDPLALAQAANLAMNAGEPLLAERWCIRLVEQAPHREEGYVGLLNLYASDTPLRDDDKAADVVRRLRANVASSRMIRVLSARDLAQRGQLDLAAEQLLEVLDSRPSDDSAASLLIAIWLQSGRTGQAVEWSRERADLLPQDSATVRLLAESLARAQRPQDAADLLRQWLVRRPGEFEVSRTLEAILREALAAPAEADAVAMERLMRAPRTPRTLLELADLHYRRKDYARSAQTLLELLDESTGPLTPDQLEAANTIASVLARNAVDDASHAQAAARTLSALLDRGASLSPQTHSYRLRLLALNGDSVDEIALAARTASAQNTNEEFEPWIQAVNALRIVERSADGVAVARRAEQELRGVTPTLAALWLLNASSARDVEGVEDAIRAAERDGQSSATMELLIAENRPIDGVPAAELAYLFANDFYANARENDGDRLYALALEFDPSHAMANNNLGYRLAEQGRNLELAYRMISTAYRVNPNEVSIIDSMGWILYRFGVLEDLAGPDGQIVREGAVTLLERASNGAEGDERRIILDHLGDALYHAGRHDEAREAWTRAVELARTTAGGLNQNRVGPRVDAFERELRAFIDLLDAKLDALQKGRDVNTAEIMGEGELPDLPPLPAIQPLEVAPDGDPAA